MGRKSSENPCPQEVLIKQLAEELDITVELAKHIYETFTVTCIELLDEYDCVKVLPFVFLERKMTTPKKMYNVNTGELCMTESKEQLKARVTPTYKDVDSTNVYVERRNERLEKQAIYEAQVQQEREERQKLMEEEKRRQRRNARKRSRYKKQKERARKRAIERMIEDEIRFEAHEREQYKKDLQKRLK